MKKWFAVAFLFAPAVVHPLAPVVAASPPPQLTEAPPVLSVIEADMRGFVVTFRPSVHAAQVVINARVYDSLSVAGAVAPRAPNVPFIARPFAVPAGAEATARIVSSTTTRRVNRWLRPTPPNWEDDETAPDAPVVETPSRATM